MNNTNNVNAKCPFYKADTAHKIRCEGCAGVQIALEFPSERAKKRYQIENCDRVKSGCPYKRVAEEEYRDR